MKISSAIFDPKTRRIHHYYLTDHEESDVWIKSASGWMLKQRVDHFAQDTWSAKPIR